MKAALTAALPHLAPQPTGSDELRMQKAFCCSDGCVFPDSCRASYTIVPKGYMRVIAAVRAEERAAHIETILRLEAELSSAPSISYLAAQATQIAALRSVVLSIDPRHAMVSRDSSLSWVEWNVLRDAALEMSGGGG